MTLEEVIADPQKIIDALDALGANNARLLKELKAERLKNREVDIEAYNATLEELEALKTTSQQVSRDSKATIDRLTADLATKDTYLKKIVIEDGLTKALLSAGVGKEQLSLAVKALKSDTQLKQTETGYNAFIEDKPVAEYVKEWVLNGDGKALTFKIQDVGGGASGGASSSHMDLKKYFDIKSPEFNLTKQAEILKTNPEIYKQLK